MKYQNYFKIKLQIDNVFNIEQTEVTFNSISLRNEDEEHNININNRHFFYLVDKGFSNIIDLYIQNDGTNINERIDYLLDEDYEIVNLSLIVKEKQINLNYKILYYEQVDSIEYESNGFVKEFISKKYVDNTICILGPKPPQMYGYNMDDPTYQVLENKIIDKIRPLINVGKNVILTNGYIGGETLGYNVANKLKAEYPQLINVLAVPFLNLDEKWIDKSKKTYKNMIENADAFIEIDKVNNFKYGTPEIYTKEKLIKKNDFDIEYASIFVVIDDYDDTLKSIKKAINYYGKSLITIHI